MLHLFVVTLNVSIHCLKWALIALISQQKCKLHKTWWKLTTRQLPMGAGHCQWSGFTDGNVCNIHGGEHLASHYRAMLRTATFIKFGNLPATLETCQYWETFIEGAPSFYNFWQVAKICWHAANSTPPDPPWIVPHTAPVTKIGLEKAYFHGYLTLTLDLWPWNVKNQRTAIKTYLYTKNDASRSDGLGATGLH